MTKRSHWISIVVFFVMGGLSGVVAAAKLAERHYETGMEKRWAFFHDFVLSRDESLAHMHGRMERGHQAMDWLELEAAGHVDLARREAEMSARAALITVKGLPEPLPWGTTSLRARVDAWLAGEPGDVQHIVNRYTRDAEVMAEAAEGDQ
jgi:hypothetical protein